MNQVKNQSEFEAPMSAPVPPEPKITKADAQFLQSVLVEGEQAIARQRDMVEMHKRIVSMFSTLKIGLSEQHAKKASEDRAALVQKLNKMESSVNGLEGALRIEMAPQLEQMLEVALDRRVPREKQRRFGLLGILMASIVSLAAGARYSVEIIDITTNAAVYFGQFF